MTAAPLVKTLTCSNKHCPNRWDVPVVKLATMPVTEYLLCPTCRIDAVQLDILRKVESIPKMHPLGFPV